jgi:hypothetical protein
MEPNVYPSANEGLLRQFDVRTAPDRLRAYCEALERRIEELERRPDPYLRLVMLEDRIRVLEERQP